MQDQVTDTVESCVSPVHDSVGNHIIAVWTVKVLTAVDVKRGLSLCLESLCRYLSLFSGNKAFSDVFVH